MRRQQKLDDADDAAELVRCRLEGGRVLWQNPRRPDDEWRPLLLDVESTGGNPALHHVLRAMRDTIGLAWRADAAPELRFGSVATLFPAILAAYVSAHARLPSFSEHFAGRMYVHCDDAWELTTCRVVGRCLLWRNPRDLDGTWRELALELAAAKVTRPLRRSKRVRRSLADREFVRPCVAHEALRHVVREMKKCLGGPWYDEAAYCGELVDEDHVAGSTIERITLVPSVRHSAERAWRHWEPC